MSTSPRVPWLTRLAVVAASLLVYLVACFVPAVYFDKPGQEPWPGVMTLILGAFALFEGQFAWLANPLLGVALLLLIFRQWVATAVVAGLAFLVSLDTLRLLGETVWLDEGGVNKAVATGLGPAFYLWIASMLVPLAGALVLRTYERSLRAG
jgi:uncharacterized protein YqgC (DUF456 family)